MVDNNDDYIICTDDCSLADAISAMKSSSAVILDCEGADLGAQGGSLSLISFRATEPPTSDTYLVDTVSLTGDQLRPLFDIIQSPSPTKIVFDGRMDFSELYHGYNVSMQGVLDLQLADVESRHQRGEDEDDQLRRLSPYLHRREIFGQPKSYTALQKLCGLEQCIREHDVIVDGLGRNQSVNHASWMSRPLPEEYLRYASRDVYLIALLYTHLKKEGYINDKLPAQSARYVTIWQDARPDKQDEFKLHPLLPLQILDYSGYGKTMACLGCRRNLPAAGFPKTASRLVKKRKCWVCRAISVRMELHSNWAREDSDY